MQRDLYWDSLKFVLIFLVVYGHMLEIDAPDGSFNRSMYNLIYAFHMPLFIFVSGRFSHIHDKERYKKSISRLIETYVVFQLIWYAVKCYVEKEFLWSMFTRPYTVLWYLVALVYWRLMILYLPVRWLDHKRIVLTISVVLSILAGFVPVGDDFVLQRSLAFLPFFMLGFYSTNSIRLPPPLALIGLLLAYIVMFFVLNKDVSSIVHCSFTYYAQSRIKMFTLILGRCLLLPSAVIISLFVMRLVPANKILASWGRETLFILVYHAFAWRLVGILVGKGLLPYNEPMALIYAVAVTIVMLLVTRIELLKRMLNPITYKRR